MCLLIVVRGRFPSHPILVASNRDERLDRRAAPPGLWVGHRHHVISPRDRHAGGTWLGVNDAGMFAGLTNIAGAHVPEGAATRGELVHIALDEHDLDRGVEAVRARVGSGSYGGFQLVLCDGERTVVLRHTDGHVQHVDWPQEVMVASNEHAPGELLLPGLDTALAAVPGRSVADVDRQLDRLQPLLVDDGSAGGHRVLKRGERFGTVSSSLLAVPAADHEQLLWRYAAGPPDRTPYRGYGNLGRRLLRSGEPLPSDRPPGG